MTQSNGKDLAVTFLHKYDLYHLLIIEGELVRLDEASINRLAASIADEGKESELAQHMLHLAKKMYTSDARPVLGEISVKVNFISLVGLVISVCGTVVDPTGLAFAGVSASFLSMVSHLNDDELYVFSTIRGAAALSEGTITPKKLFQDGYISQRRISSQQELNNILGTLREKDAIKWDYNEDGQISMARWNEVLR